MNIFDKIIDWFGCDEGYTVRKPEEQKQLNISQPIYEFVELMKSDFKRFDVKRLSLITINITDTKTGLSIPITTMHGYGDVSSHLTWVTDDEASLIDSTLSEIYASRTTRIAKVREWQNKRKRDKWVNVYCNNLEAK